MCHTITFIKCGQKSREREKLCAKGISHTLNSQRTHINKSSNDKMSTKIKWKTNERARERGKAKNKFVDK